MANYSDDEFRSRLQAVTNAASGVEIPFGPQPAPKDDFASRAAAILPRSQGAVNAPPSAVVATPSLTLEESEGRMSDTGERIPLDIRRQLPLSEYMFVSNQRGPEAQLEALKKLYPDKNPRMLESGDVVIQIIDSDTGKPKDVSANAHGITGRDLMDLFHQAPEFAVSTAVALSLHGRGFVKTAAQMVLSAAAGAGTGAIRDVSARTTAGIDMRLGEIAQSRGEEFGLDLFLQTGLLGAAKGLRAASPFARDIKPDTMEFDLQKGQEFLKREFGEVIPLTPADTTGSVALRSVEAVEGPQPGWRTVLTKLREKKSEVVRNVQRRALGQISSEEAIGERAIGTLRDTVVGPLEGALTKARQIAEQKSNQRVIDLIDDAVGMKAGSRVTPTMAGKETIGEFDAKLAQAEERVNVVYGEFKALPGGTGDVLSGTPAAKAAKEIRDELPKVATTKEVVKYDQYGSPMAASVPSEELLKSGVPDGLLKAIDDLESLRGGKVSLQTLTNMKRSAYDAIAAFKTAHGDVKDRWFKKIAAAYEQGIQEGIDETGDPALKAALTKAKDTYKKELLPFERPGLKELAKDEFDAGRLSPEQAMTRLFEGPKAIENYTMLKEVLGKDNPVFRTLKRAWFDTKIADATDNATGSIDPNKLGASLKELSTSRPELAEELFGKHHAELASALQVKSALQRIEKLDETEIKTLLRLKDPTVKDFELVVDMQRTRDKAYVNGMLKDVADGLPISSDLKPTEFIKRLTNTATPTKDVQAILEALTRENPEARQAIATATLYRIFDAASIREAATALRGTRQEPMNISATALAEALGRGDKFERNALLLGENLIAPGAKTANRREVAENLIKVLAPGELKQGTMSAAGGLATGVAVNKLLHSPLQYASGYAQKFFLATVYTLAPIQKLITNRAFSPSQTATLANALIASEPFVRRVVETLGDETKAGQLLDDLKNSIDRYVGELKGDDSPGARRAAETEKFVRGEPARMRITPER